MEENPEGQEEQVNQEETLELGGNIELTGFREVDPGMMIVVKKIIGSYAKKFSEKHADFEKLALTLKSVHKTEGSEKHELHAKLITGGKPTVAEITDRNMFFALDGVMKKLENSI